MKRSNTGKFLARNGVRPAFAKAQGYFYWEVDIERLRAARQADEAKIAADERRRAGALRRARGEPPEVVREAVPPEIRHLGRTQRSLIEEMLRRPVAPGDSTRFALLRLRKRGLAETTGDGSARRFVLSDEGRRVAGFLR